MKLFSVLQATGTLTKSLRIVPRLQLWKPTWRHDEMTSLTINLWAGPMDWSSRNRLLCTMKMDADDVRNEINSMDNIYQEWTIAQDRILWENRQQAIAVLASMMGRGLRGTEQRLTKLRNVETAAYARLFANNKDSIQKNVMANDNLNEKDSPKLVPASEVLRRIQWDESISSSDFTVLHYDRVADTIVESSVDATNNSIAGKASRFIDALPEHRIVGIKYKERLVWDRENKRDEVFANEGIISVIKGYDKWKKNKDDEEEAERQRYIQVKEMMLAILGSDRFGKLKKLSMDLTANVSPESNKSSKVESERYVQAALDLIREGRSDPSIKLTDRVPRNDAESLDSLSEYVASLSDPTIRQLILVEISLRLKQADGSKLGVDGKLRSLPEIDENDLTETFVRGSGPGGQKVNKTSNRVFLVHEPTQLRVECQETRSLPQNRKIARKRLREKLDEYLNGNQSKANVAAQKASTKKTKTKARNRARQRQRILDGTFEGDDGESPDDATMN